MLTTLTRAILDGHFNEKDVVYYRKEWWKRASGGPRDNDHVARFRFVIKEGITTTKLDPRFENNKSVFADDCRSGRIMRRSTD